MPPTGLGQGILNWVGKVYLSCKNKYCTFIFQGTKIELCGKIIASTHYNTRRCYYTVNFRQTNLNVNKKNGFNNIFKLQLEISPQKELIFYFGIGIEGVKTNKEFILRLSSWRLPNSYRSLKSLLLFSPSFS